MRRGEDHGDADSEILLDVHPVHRTPVSFSDLYAEQFVPLVRLATLMVGRGDAARDVVQDAFVQLHQKWSTVRNPGAYVRRSVINGCKSHYRREGRRRREIESASGTADLDEHPRLHTFDHTLASLSALNHRQRAVIVLKFYEDRSEREIAAIVGCRPGSVGPTLQRALAALRSNESPRNEGTVR